MTRDVFLTVSTTLKLRVDEGVEVSEVMDSAELHLELNCGDKASVEDFQVTDWNVEDSK
jgi:hypothetical protein